MKETRTSFADIKAEIHYTEKCLETCIGNPNDCCGNKVDCEARLAYLKTVVTEEAKSHE